MWWFINFFFFFLRTLFKREKESAQKKLKLNFYIYIANNKYQKMQQMMKHSMI